MAPPDPAAHPGPIRPAADPTVRIARPEAGSRPAAAPGRPARPAHPDDQSTVGIPRPAPRTRQPTIRFGTPAPVRVTVTATTRRRYRTWPWIAAVVAALVVLGVVLLVMLVRGATVEGSVGAPATAAPGVGAPAVPVGWRAG